MFSSFASRALTLLSVPLLAAGVFTVVSSGPARAAVAAGSVRGVNWADPRDNFVCGNLVLSGLYDGESYDTVYSKASAITSKLAAVSGANTIRLPVNVNTSSGSWWNSYVATVDAATAQGLNVILSEWDQCDSRDGKLDSGWQGLWDKVIAKYGGNDRVLFEIMNEPYGYSSADWLNTAASWISRYSSVPRGRIVVSGPGYNDNAYTVGRDSRFSGTLLSIHHYAFWQGAMSYDAWRAQTRSKVAEFASRTIFTEFGTFMTTGLNFNDTSAGTNEIQYLRGVTDEFNSLGVGSVYWPGLRGGDTYSLTSISGASQNGSGSSISLSLNNASGLARVRNGWRQSTGVTTTTTTGTSSTSTLVGAQSNRCLDLPAGNTANGTAIKIYDCNGGSNQRWTYTSGRQLQVLGKCLDVSGQSSTPGAAVTLYDCNGGTNQQWTFSNGTIVGVQSGLCLEVKGQATANSSVVDVWTCNGGSNQRWNRV